MKIVVTGAAGFIGSAFVRLCQKELSDAQFLLIDKTPGNFELNLNLQDPDFSPASTRCLAIEIGSQEMRDLLHEFQPTHIVNFAAETHVDRSIDNAAPFIDSNIVQLQKMLDQVVHLDSNPMFVQISTDEVYGDRKGKRPSSPGGDLLDPSNPYAASKAAAEFLVRAYGRTHGLNWKITRGANTYGPRQFPEKLIPLMIAKAMVDEPLPVYGDGEQIRDWIHVEDHTSAILHVMTHEFSDDITNIGSGVGCINLNLVHMIRRLLRSESVIQHVEDRPGHDRQYRMRVDPLHRWWEPEYELEKGLTQTINWYGDNEEWITEARERYTTERVGLGEKS
jgi:dTDP-glucose 4,6-dehydratase